MNHFCYFCGQTALRYPFIGLGLEPTELSWGAQREIEVHANLVCLDDVRNLR